MPQCKPENRNAQRMRNYHKTKNARNSRSRWTASEIELLHDNNMTDRELSAEIGRSVQAIQVKRYYINKEL
jgi:hypothetical protein